MAAASIGFLRNPDGLVSGSRNLSQYPSAANLEIITGTGIHWGVAASIISVLFFIYCLYTQIWLSNKYFRYLTKSCQVIWN